MSVYPPQQSPPSYEDEDLLNNIYTTDSLIPRTVNQSTFPPVDIAHANNPNSEACSNPNYPTWPDRIMPQTNPIASQSNQTFIGSAPSAYPLWSLITFHFSCMVYK